MVHLNKVSENVIKNSQCNIKHSSEYEYVTMFKNIFDRELFPNDFNIRSIEEQYIWINENIAEFFPNAPQSLLSTLPSCYRPLNLPSMKKPKWLDVNKYYRGQEFVREHYASIVLTTIAGLIYMYSFNEFPKPIIMSRHTDTLYLGFKRYLSSIQRFFNWYNGEPWIEGTPAYKDMLYARKMHMIIRDKLLTLDNEQIDNASKISKPWCPDRELLLKDFASTCPFENVGQRPYLLFNKMPYRPKGVNNMDMAITQCCFVSPLILWPENVGVHDATDDDLEALCHMWRCYGYYLGIEDEYNFCRGSLEEIKQRMRDLYQYWIIPNFKEVTPEWEHMTRCLVVPFNYYPFIYMPYKVMILIVTDLINLKMLHLYTSLSYSEWIAYKMWKFLIDYVAKLKILQTIVDKVLRKSIETAYNYSPEKHAELQEKSKKQLPHLSTMY